MPMYDRQCPICLVYVIDCLEPVTPPRVDCPQCGGHTRRTWLNNATSVIGDECDVMVKHGLCNPDGSPRRYTSKADMRDEAKRRGLESHVEHLGTKGGDRSPHTTRWI